MKHTYIHILPFFSAWLAQPCHAAATAERNEGICRKPKKDTHLQRAGQGFCSIKKKTNTRNETRETIPSRAAAATRKQVALPRLAYILTSSGTPSKSPPQSRQLG